MRAENSSELLETFRSIAIVGVSDKPDRPSHQVAKYLLEQSEYSIYLVNPSLTTLFGRKVYANLSVLQEEVGDIDIVDVFRRQEELQPVYEEAKKIGAKVFWMQLGLKDPEIVADGDLSGIEVVEDQCIKVVHQAL